MAYRGVGQYGDSAGRSSRPGARSRLGAAGFWRIAPRALLFVGVALSLGGGCVVEPLSDGADTDALKTASVVQAVAPIPCLCPKSCLQCFGQKECPDPVDTCRDIACNPEACPPCITRDARNGEDCDVFETKETGQCIDGSCCVGCFMKEQLSCEEGDSADACGIRGEECRRCSKAADEGAECVVDVCEKGECGVAPVQNGIGCNGGVCHNGTCCTGCIKGGVCYQGGQQSATACGLRGEVCDVCADGNVCNGIESCVQGECQDGTPLTCDDGNPCTQNSCNPTTGCTYPADNAALCSDGNACTTGDQCVGGQCVGTGTMCNDNNPCTDDACMPGAGCVFTPKMDGEQCNDGNECSENDVCAQGRCLGSGGPDCDDNNPCTVDACNVNTQACEPVNEDDGTACDNGNRCTQGDSCIAGECTAGEPIDCDDGNPCTIDACDPVEGCTHEPTDAECSDGDACTVNDACVDGECVGEGVGCLAIDECHSAGDCDPDNGLCTDPRKPDGAECTGGTCMGGVCDRDEVVPEGGAGGEAGNAGEGGAGGGAGEGGEGGDEAEGGSGGEGEGGEGGEASASPEEEGDVFKRKPGGCGCAVPGNRGLPPLGLVAALGLALLTLTRRRRRLTTDS